MVERPKKASDEIPLDVSISLNRSLTKESPPLSELFGEENCSDEIPCCLHLAEAAAALLACVTD